MISLSHPLLCPVVVEDRQHRRQRERRFLRREGEEEKEFGGEKAEVKGEAKPVPLSQEGNGMLVKGEELELMNDLLPKEYFLDVVRFAKFRLYQPFHDVLIAPGLFLPFFLFCVILNSFGYYFSCFSLFFVEFWFCLQGA